MRRKFKKRKQIVLSVEQEHFDFLVKKCIELSGAEGRQITVSELTRNALEHYVPLPETMDIFGNVDKSKIKYQKR